MLDLTAHHLRCTLLVKTPIELNTHQGAALRGMLFNALRGPRNNPALGFCAQRDRRSCLECPLLAGCPVAGLVATMNSAADRGRDAPRPYAIVPPFSLKTHYQAGERLTFGLTLFGDALKLFPYLIMALHQAGPRGLGKRFPRPEAGDKPHRGRFILLTIWAVNLLTGETQEILATDDRIVDWPELPVTQAQVEQASRLLLDPPLDHSTNGAKGSANFQRGQTNGPIEITLEFKTPTRIIEQKKLLKQPHFAPLFHRLLDRLLALNREFATEPAARQPPVDKNELLALSDRVELIADQTHWQEVYSYSARQGRTTPISGLVGRAVYRADRTVWERLLPYLLWGAITHVGKNAVKGDGVIGISR